MYCSPFVRLVGILLPVLTIFLGYGHAQDAYKQIYQFSNTPFTRIENIAVRSNGDILLNTVTSATTYLLDPSSNSPSPQLLHTYPDANSTLGIAEVQDDIFAIVVGNYSIANIQGIKGSFAVWTIDFRNGLPGTATKVTSIPQAQGLNGATAIAGSPDLVLIADSALGTIWKVNITSGYYTQVIESNSVTPPGSFPPGVNGIHTRESTLYFTNSPQGIFGKVPITADGSANGAVTQIASRLSSSLIYDDFTFDRVGNAYVTNHPYTITMISPSGSQVVIINNNTAFDQPTSAAFARGTQDAICTLYVVTAGSSSTHSGQLISVNTC